MEGERYIDIDEEAEHAGMETETFEQIVIRQIREAAVSLSKPREGGQTIERMIKGKKQYVRIPDTRETVIRTVDTLRSLLLPFIKEKLKEDFEKLDKEKKEMETKLGDIKIKIGNKEKKVKEFNFIPPNHFVIKMRMEKECDIAEKLFAVLVKAFHKSRMELREYETD